MEYTFNQLKVDVLQEANNLKQHATIEERSKLNVGELRPYHTRKCIYGLMTGHCDSARALELIQKCTVRYIADDNFTWIDIQGFKRIQNHLNGTTVENLHRKRTNAYSSETSHFSMIEAYILLPEANNAGLINYIQGKLDTVEL
jgi:hypothetical protein